MWLIKKYLLTKKCNNRNCGYYAPIVLVLKTTIPFHHLHLLNFPISNFLSPILLRTSILIIFLIMSSSFLICCIRDFLQIYSRMRYLFQLTMIRLFSYSSILIEDRSLSNTELTFSIVGGTILKTIMPTLPFS